MKVILSIAILLISIQSYGQKREISQYSATVSDSILTLQVMPILDTAIKLIKNSSIPAKEATNSMDQLNAIGVFLANDIERQKKEAETKEPVKKAKCK